MGIQNLSIGKKVGLGLILDFIDFFMPPGIGTIYDGFLTWLSYKMWGFILIPAIEIGEFTDRVDAFLPSLTLTAIWVNRKKISSWLK